MNLIVRIVAATLAIAAFSIPTTVLADSPNAGGAVMRSTTSQATAHFVTIDGTGCIRNDLFIHGVVGTPGAIDADVQSTNICTNTLLLLTGGTNFDANVQVDAALQTGQVSGTILTFDRLTGNALPVTIELTWTGTGRLLTTPLAPGQAANGGSGFHITTPFANVTLNGVVSARAATVFGSIDVPGFTFPISSLQSDLTFLSAGSDNFIVTLKP